MTKIEGITQNILAELLLDFRKKALSAEALSEGYEGVPLSRLAARDKAEFRVDFDLALQQLEDRRLIETGPMAVHENEPGSTIFFLGMYSKCEYAYLTERGYKLATQKEGAPDRSQPRRDDPEDVHLFAIHPDIQTKCMRLFESGEYAEAVEKSFKIVRDRLRSLTGHERGSEAFGKGKLHVLGAAAPHVDSDFNEAVKFLTMAIDMFRNEKSHTSDARIDNPVRAHQYLSLSSLAMSLLERTEIKP